MLATISGKRRTRWIGSFSAPAGRSVVIWRIRSTPSTSGLGPSLTSDENFSAVVVPKIAATAFTAALISRHSMQRVMSTWRFTAEPAIPPPIHPTRSAPYPSSDVQSL